MSKERAISKTATTVLVYGRPFLAFGGLLCAIGVMWNRSPSLYVLGVGLLFVSMTFDLVDGWFAARFQPHPTLAPLADKIMDKIVYSIIFPLVAVGMMWRLLYLPHPPSRLDILHAVFVMLVCVAVLIRDNFASFMRSFAIRQGTEPEPSEYTRLRTIVAAPVGALLYAHAFYIPDPPGGAIFHLYGYLTWLGRLPARGLFVIEILFFIITFGSIAAYCRRYGNLCLDELCLEDERLRRRILSFFPNGLTVMNAMMGLLAVFFAYQYRIREAFLLLIGACIFDRLDGYVARKLGLTDPLPGEGEAEGAGKRRLNLGSILDDLADGVSFCVVPAWIFHILFSDAPEIALRGLPSPGLVASLYAVAGIARLIYFTLDKTPIPGFFKGMPTPAAAMAVTSPLIMFHQSLGDGVPESIRFWSLTCMGMMLLSMVLMNLYPIRYLHVGRCMGRNPWFGRSLWIVLAVAMFTPFLGHIGLLYCIAYILSPLVTWRIDPSTAARESQPPCDAPAEESLRPDDRQSD